MPSTAPRATLRPRLGRNVRCAANPAVCSRAGKASGGLPSQVWPLAIRAFAGARLCTPISTSSGSTEPSGT
ncbi:hypothetical protein D3C71_1461980 [compost metagenome]